MRSNFYLLSIFFGTFYITPQTSLAYFEFSFWGGGGFGSLELDQKYTSSYLPLGSSIAIGHRFWDSIGIGTLISLHHARLIYIQGDITYGGVLTSPAIGIHTHFNSSNYSFIMELHGLKDAQISAKSEKISKINEYITKTSTLINYKAPQGGILRLAFLMLNRVPQIGRNTQMKFGISFEAGYLGLQSEVLNVRSNTQTSAPNFIRNSQINGSFTFADLALIIQFVI